MYAEPVIIPKTIENKTHGEKATLTLGEEVSPNVIGRMMTEDVNTVSWETLLERTQQEQGLDTPQAVHFLLQLMQQKMLPESKLPKPQDHLNPIRGKEGMLLHPTLQKIAAMSPFIDDVGIIRAGGRLNKAYLSFGRKYPALIPRCWEGDALLNHIHSTTACHQGRIITMACIREHGYIPMGGRKRISGIISTCPRCRLLRAKPMEQKMAQLPLQRLERVPPFSRCGIDVFGPFLIKQGRTTRANPGTQKLWVLLFSCLYSRGVHLETLASMDVSSFMMAFDRFEAKWGLCEYLKSDAGSNFMGARNLEEKSDADQLFSRVQKEWEKPNKIWEVNPPKASHFGGVWERAIGSVRKVIDAVLLGLNSKLLTSEEFHTMLAIAAQIVNSTPLWQISDSPDEPIPLTPAMLLTQREHVQIVSNDTTMEGDIQAYGPNRWKRMRALADRFWLEWQRHYIYEIGTIRPKWWKPKTNAKVGNVVLIKDKNLPRLKWSTGTITKVRESDDSLIRSVTVRPHRRDDKTTTEKERDRPVHLLIPLFEAPLADIPPLPTPTEPPDSEAPEPPPLAVELKIKIELPEANTSTHAICPGCASPLQLTVGFPWCHRLHQMVLKANRGILPKEDSSPSLFHF